MKRVDGEAIQGDIQGFRGGGAYQSYPSLDKRPTFWPLQWGKLGPLTTHNQVLLAMTYKRSQIEFM